MGTRAREKTCQLLEAIDQGLVSRDTVISACLDYMSEADVAEMCQKNELLYTPEDDDSPDDN